MSSLIAIDWGTSSFRAYCLNESGKIFSAINSPLGILHVEKDEFAIILASEVSRLEGKQENSPIILSGMITSKNGWVEAPYVECPASCSQLAEHLVLYEDDTLGPLWFVPGLRQFTPQPDVIRGEETQIAGLEQVGEHVVILPGTHSKWVHMQDYTVMSFSTCMTGDVYSALLQNTILSTAADGSWTQTAFIAGLQAAQQYHKQQKSLLSTLFQTRAQEILGLAPAKEGKGFLSGLLIGTEICDALSLGYDSKRPYTIIGEDTLVLLYRQALELYGKSSMVPKYNPAAKGLYRIARAKNLI